MKRIKVITTTLRIQEVTTILKVNLDHNQEVHIVEVDHRIGDENIEIEVKTKRADQEREELRVGKVGRAISMVIDK
jgi:hypothetical protein